MSDSTASRRERDLLDEVETLRTRVAELEARYEAPAEPAAEKIYTASDDPRTEEIDVREALASYQRHLENIVEERTAELVAANERLQREASELADAQRRQHLMATALEAVRQGVAITDADFEPPGPKMLFVNDTFCEMSGYSPEEFAGQPVSMLVVEEVDSELRDELIADLRAGRSFRQVQTHRRKDGTEYLAANHVSPVFDADGELNRLVLIQQDVTERRRSERALRRSEERYRLLIQRLNEGFVATDCDNRIDLVNERFVRMLGYPSDELIGRYLGNFVDDENRDKLDAQEAHRRHGLAAPYELTWLHRDGREVDTVISPTSLLDGDGRFLGSFAVVTDVTERKRAEEERRKLEGRIRKAQKMESLGLLAGGIAHDFNNLLVGILGHAGLALMELPPEAPAHALVRQIETAAMRASELTKEMLAYSGKGRFLVELIDLSTLVEEMAHLMRVSISKKALLEFDFADDLPRIEGDPTQIRQIVMNLITNASEAIGDRTGVIRIKTGKMFAGPEYLASTYMDDQLEAREYVFLEVSDSGSGMDEETRSKIFDPFFTTKFTGRGLGLAAVLGIVRGHHGAIRVYSEPGQGTSFKVLVPAANRRAERVAEPPVAEEMSFRGSGCVLIADDEEMVRGVAQASLESVGYDVVLATDGVEAVEIFEREADRIDAVLLDMTMPRMGGEEVYRELRRLRPGIKIVLSSGFSEQDAITRFADEGLDGFLQKPFQPQQLIRVLRDILAPVPQPDGNEEATPA